MRSKVAAITVLMFICVLSLSSMSYPEQPTALIAGIIENFGESSLTINGEPVPVDEMGHFEYRLPLEKGSYVQLGIGDGIDFFLEPGDSLGIEADAGDLYGSLQVSGEGELVNAFLLRELKDAIQMSVFITLNFKRIFSMPEKDYVAFIDSLAGAFSGRLETFAESHDGINEYFVRMERATIRYSVAKALMDYPGFYRRFTGDAEFRPTEAYYFFLDDLDFNDPELLDLEEYTTFLDAYVDMQASNILADGTTFQGKNYREIRAKILAAMDTFTDATVRSEVLYRIVDPFLGEYSLKGAEDILETFRQNCVHPEYLAEIEETLAWDRDVRGGCEIQTYKTVDGMSLDALIYRPEGSKPGEKRTALAFFHGGGWSLGKPEWGHWQCEHFSELGLVCISFEYRLHAQHNATPVEGIADTKSAIRWLRRHAHDLGIDENKIVGSGFSAGGHLALCTVMINDFDEPDEDHEISSGANALLLWSTPAKIFPDGWFKRLLDGRATVAECDPSQHIRPGLPPSIFFQGTEDVEVPAWTTEEFAKQMVEAGNRCDLHIYEGQNHLGWRENSRDVYIKMEEFLVSLGFLTCDSAEPEILPDEIGATGWVRDPEISRFAGEALFEYINGAAEMYHKYDFTELVATEYHKGDGHVTADVYKFTSPDKAFGMYSTLRPDEPDTVLLGAEGFTFGANWVYVMGPYIANVYTYDESAEMLAAVRSIATTIENRLTGSRSKPPTFDMFPEKHRVDFSEKIYAESFLGQGFLTDVYTVAYEREGHRFTLFMSEDPASEKLESWRVAVTEEHDPDAGYQHLPYDGSRYLHSRDSYHGEIIAGPQGGKLIGMVGYRRQDLDIIVSWLHALIEEP